MVRGLFGKLPVFLLLFGCCCLLNAGCYTTPTSCRLGQSDTPTEKSMVIHPDYTIAPPDVLRVDAANLIPKPPYRIAPLDGLLIRVDIVGAKPDEANQLQPGRPISGVYRVEADGTLDLGFDYGSVLLRGQTLPEAKKSIKAHLKQRFKVDFDVTVALAESRSLQLIRGDHLVRQDGKVNLGTYGLVTVAGLTTEQARRAIEEHLSAFLLDPEISLDIAGFNSKVYYVIYDMGLSGETVYRLPVTGNETVLDAISQIYGMPGGLSRKRIWVARPSPADHNSSQVLPVDWKAITMGGVTATNYQVLPGDRVFVALDPWIRADQVLSKVIAPFERIFGVTLLGNSVVHGISQPLGVVGGTGVGTGAIR